MNFSDKTFEALAAYEDHFRTAVNSNYTRNPGRAALVTMIAAVKEATGRSLPPLFGCATCQLRIVKNAGRLWLADKAERAATATETAEAAAPKKPRAPRKKKTADE